MDKNELESRLAAMKAAQAQHLANANAAAGAVQELEYWLSRVPPEMPAQPELKVVGE